MRINIIRNESHINETGRWISIYKKDNQYFDFQKIEDLNVIDAAKNGYHIVTIGYLGLTVISSICNFGFGIGSGEQSILLKTVQDNKETGTVFPKAKLTILPYSRYYYEGDEFTTEEIKKHILDALEAEIKYVKSGKVIFDFTGVKDQMGTYNSILRNIIVSEFKEIEGDIYYYSIDNREFVLKEYESEFEYWKYEQKYIPFNKEYYQRWNENRQEIIQKEKAEKQKRKELKRILNEPNVIARELKIKSTRNYIQSVRNLHFSKRLALIAKSERVVYFYSEMINEILTDNQVNDFKEQIKIIISKFKENEVRQFKKLKKRLELAIQF
jgi:hypothetical protein